MRILICGGAGPVGAAVARYAGALGHDMHVVVRRATNLERIASLPIQLHDGDLRDAARLKAILQQTKPDAVVHAARIGEAHGISGRRDDLLMDSARLMLSLAEALNETKFSGALVVFGSAMVYGDGSEPRTPMTPMAPLTFSGTLKAIDSILARQAARQLDVPTTELRVFSAYGAYDRRERLTSRLAAAAVAGTTIDLTSAPTSRDWIDLRDVARACLAGCDPCHRGFEIRNICTGKTHTNHEAADIMSRLCGRNIIGDGKYDLPDTYTIRNPVGIPSGRNEGFAWSHQIDLETGLRDLLTWASSTDGATYLGITR